MRAPGRYAALAALGLFAAVTRSDQSLFATLIPLIGAPDSTLDPGNALQLARVFGIGIILGSVVFGALLSRVGLQSVAAVAIFGAATCTLLTGLVTSGQQFLALRATLGFFSGAVVPVALQAIRGCLPQRLRGTAAGLIQFSSDSVMFIVPSIAAIVALSGDWQPTFVGLGLGGYLTAFLWLRFAGQTVLPRTPVETPPPVTGRHWAYVAARLFLDAPLTLAITFGPFLLIDRLDLAIGRSRLFLLIAGAAAAGSLAGGALSDVFPLLGRSASRGRTLVFVAAAPIVLLAGVLMLSSTPGVAIAALALSAALHRMCVVNLNAALTDAAPLQRVGLLNGIGTAVVTAAVTVTVAGDFAGASTETSGFLLVTLSALALLGIAAGIVVTRGIADTTDNESFEAADSALREKSIWSFHGRIARRTFWMRSLVLLLLGAPAAYAIGALTARAGGILVWLMFGVLLVVVLWLSVAIQVKRWHDLGRSGELVCLNLTIVAVPIVWLILGFRPGVRGRNRYGADPLVNDAAPEVQTIA
jgi:uncharacterized membrane protein YhaH (DUF805 family)